MEFPEKLHYTKEHEWVMVENGVATMGITEFAQDELGEIVFVDLPDAGTQFKQGETLCVVESTKAASDVYSPIGGTVKEVNDSLGDSPDLVNSSPYENGWMVRLEGVDEAELSNLMDVAGYKTVVNQ